MPAWPMYGITGGPAAPARSVSGSPAPPIWSTTYSAMPSDADRPVDLIPAAQA